MVNLSRRGVLRKGMDLSLVCDKSIDRRRGRGGRSIDSSGVEATDRWWREEGIEWGWRIVRDVPSRDKDWRDGT